MEVLGKRPEARCGGRASGLGSQFCPQELCDLGQVTYPLFGASHLPSLCPMSLLEAGRLTTELSHRQQHRLEETEQGDLRSLAPAAALGLPFLRGPFVPALSFTSVHTGSVRSSSQAGVYSPASSPPLLQCTHSFVCQADPTSTARPSPACGRRPRSCA